MVSWFKKKIVKWVREAHENAYANDASIKVSNHIGLAIPTGNSFNVNSGLNFTICRAEGGYIVQTQYWDSRQGSNVNTLHIITDDKDIGKELNKIFIFTNLKH
jgi:hypothetical protein